MNEEDKLVLGTLAGVDLILSPEHYEEYKRTLNKQIKTISKELDQYKNNWEELKRILEKQLINCNKCSGQSYYFKYILDKMKELEENN